MYGYIYRTNFNNGEFYYIGKHKSDVFEGEKYIGSGKHKKFIELKKSANSVKVDLIEKVYG